MTRAVTIDLGSPDPGQLETLWNELERHREVRCADPELREDILRAIDRALLDGLLDGHAADEIRRELDETVPAAVLEQHWRELIPDRPSLGAYSKDRPARPNVDAKAIVDDFYKTDHRRLALIVEESTRLFGPDMRRSARHGFRAAKRFGIAPETAQPIIAEALRNLRSNKEAHRDAA